MSRTAAGTGGEDAVPAEAPRAGGGRMRRAPVMAVVVGVTTVAMLAVLASLLLELGSITSGFKSSRVVAAQNANAQRDIHVFHRAVMRLATGGSVGEAQLRRALALQQLKTLVHQERPHRGGRTTARERQLLSFARRLRSIDLRRLGAPGDSSRALSGVDEDLTEIERDFKLLYDRSDQAFQRTVAEALSARVGAQRWLGALILLTLVFAAAWMAQTRRRSRGDLEAAYRAVRESEERFRSLVQNSSDLTLIVAPSGRISYASPAAAALTGRSPGELVGLELAALAHEDDQIAIARALARLDEEGGCCEDMEFRVVHPDLSVRHLDATASNLRDDPAVGALVLNIRDVTDRRRLEAELAQLAFHDSLTLLPNRALLRERIESALARARATPGAAMALLLIDLDDFKAVNDGIGHEEGDRLLVSVADRLREHVRSPDTVARLGGDEFVVFAERVGDRDAACQLAERLLAALAEPFDIEPGLLPGGASIGVRYVEGGELSADELMRDADLAMYSAKSAGKGSWRLFEPGMHDSASARLTLRAELHRALEARELLLHYQPVVDARSEDIVGFEALVRWCHPTRGLVGPDQFIGLAEETGLIIPLGEWVLGEATAAARRLQDVSGRDDLVLSVNLSPRQLDAGGLADTVRNALGAAGLPPECLVLEVTESVFLAETTMVSAQLDELRELGVQVALDDFGTGFSSLAYLERLPLDHLKVDRSFVAALTGTAPRGALVATIVRLAEALDLHTVAEGVETREQLQALRALGCRSAQGYLFSRPVPEREARELLRTWAPDAETFERSAA